jgi:hypothetical protein
MIEEQKMESKPVNNQVRKKATGKTYAPGLNQTQLF